jgi:hypothetical protein
MASATTACIPCNQKDLLWTFVWDGVAYQSTDHSKINAKRRDLGANTARLARRPKQDNARQV